MTDSDRQRRYQAILDRLQDLENRLVFLEASNKQQLKINESLRHNIGTIARELRGDPLLTRLEKAE